MNLYRVTLNGMTSKTSGTAYGDSFVVAENPDQAYTIVREFLNKEDIGYDHDRSLHLIKLIAEQKRFPECRTMLFVKREK